MVYINIIKYFQLLNIIGILKWPAILYRNVYMRATKNVLSKNREVVIFRWWNSDFFVCCFLYFYILSVIKYFILVIINSCCGKKVGFKKLLSLHPAQSLGSQKNAAGICNPIHWFCFCFGTFSCILPFAELLTQTLCLAVILRGQEKWLNS